MTSPAEFFSRLNKHQHIAWDFDETLCGWHGAPVLLSYIHYHPEKTHSVITFRNCLKEIKETLSEYNIQSFHAFPFKNETKTVLENLSWKPETCVTIGATALVDDIVYLEDYCNDLGIEYFNSANAAKRRIGFV